MHPSNVLAALVFSAVVFASPSAQALEADGKDIAYEDVIATPIHMGNVGHTILGQPFKYPAGTPSIKAYNIQIPAGQSTDLHRHAVPLFAWVVSGVMEVDYGSKGKRTITAGTAYIEAINWCHVGKAVGSQPVTVVGVFLGQVKPDQLAPEACAKAD